MKVIVRDFGEKFGDTGLWITPHSDIHKGHPEYNPVVHQRELDWLGAAPNHFAILAGDLCEMALKDSVGEVYEQALSPQKQADAIIADYRPHADRLLAACGGNHESRVYRLTGFDPSMIYASALGVPYRAEGFVLVVRFGTRQRSRRTHGTAPQSSTYTLYVTHGWGAARTVGAKLKNVSELRGVVSNADVYVAGHTHQPGYYPLDTFEIVDSKVGDKAAKRRTQHFVSLGSALDYAGYAQQKGYGPTTLSFPRIWLAPYVDRKRDGERNTKVVRVTSGDMPEAA